uniref:Serpin peptidase inhibitor, clade E (nexin, plasminogen activator inhibitor type 1), member 3 n=1 Tax=Fundulus heteroclitus TaxID=8078 RepID=A0A3Q2PKT2_FUNHE
MCRLPLASVLVLLCLAERSHCTGSFQDSMRELHGRFAVSLYQTLTGTENSSNLIVSPASVSLSLALLQLGARGDTRAQLEATLGYNVNDAQVRDFLLHSQGDLSNSSQGTWLQQTCTLFIQSGVQLLAEFTQQAAAWANASVLRANLSQPHHARNEWWPLQSGSSSGELSGSGEAQAEALWWGRRPQVALVNTVAFRGVWQKQFMSSSTQNLPFILSDGSTIKVPMMHQAAEVRFGQFRTASDQRYTVLELPYLGRSLSLQVVLPSERKSPLSLLESQLTARQLASWDSGLRRTKMDIFLPSLQIRFVLSHLPNLENTSIKCRFCRLHPTSSDPIKKKTIQMSESEEMSDTESSWTFLFIFIILCPCISGSILFMGRMMNPAERAM